MQKHRRFTVFYLKRFVSKNHTNFKKNKRDIL